FRKMLGNDGIFRQQATGDPAKQCPASPYHDRKSFDDRKEQGAARNDDRDADRKTKTEQHIVALRSSRDSNHVVETHYDICDYNDATCPPEVLDRFGRIFGVVRLRRYELDGHPEQGETARELEIG